MAMPHREQAVVALILCVFRIERQAAAIMFDGAARAGMRIVFHGDGQQVMIVGAIGLIGERAHQVPARLLVLFVLEMDFREAQVSFFGDVVGEIAQAGEPSEPTGGRAALTVLAQIVGKSKKMLDEIEQGYLSGEPKA